MADIFEVTLQAQVYNHVLKTVIHLNGGTGSFSEEFVANDVIANFMPKLVAQQVVPMRYTVCHVRKISPTLGDPYIKEIIYGYAQMNAAMLPPVLCVLMELFSATKTKSGRGKMFISGLWNARAETTGWNSYVPDSFKATFDQLQASYSVNTTARPLVWGIWSRKTSTFYPITSVRILSKFAIQRRRNINLLT